MQALRPGDLIGDRYRIETVLAKGGMGAVYLATDERLGRSVALKILLKALSDDATAIARFEREARATATLSHPSIVAMLDFGTTPDGMTFLVMEHLAGRTLASWLDEGPMVPARAVDVTMQALGALSVAHAAGIVHRDLKPANLMLVPRERSAREHGADLVKVLDFGLAQIKSGEAYTRLTSAGSVVGTPLFMSPEQSRGETCDARTDVYAMGMVLWCALTGQAPFDVRDLARLVVSVQSEVPRRADQVLPSVPSMLATIAQKAMEKRPADRYASAAELSSALEMARPSVPPPAIASVRPAAIASIRPGPTASVPPVAASVPPMAMAAPAASSPWPRVIGCAALAGLGLGVAVLAATVLGYVVYAPTPAPVAAPPSVAAPMIPTPPPTRTGLPTAGQETVEPPGPFGVDGGPCARAFACCRAYWERVEPMAETCDEIVGGSAGDVARCEEQRDGWDMTSRERGTVLPECRSASEQR